MNSVVVAAAALAIALPAAAAETDTQLQFTLGGTGVAVGGGVYAPGAAISFGFERDENVYLLGLGMTWIRAEQVVSAFQQPDGTVKTESALSRNFGVTLAPGYRRYLGVLESTIAPFLEAHATFGFSWNSPDFGSPGRTSSTSLLFGLSGAAGAEVRLQRHFALTARVIATAGLSHRGGLFSQDSQDLALGSDAGFLFRF